MVPDLLEVQPLPHRTRHLKDNLVARGYDLPRNVQKHPTKGGGIHVRADALRSNIALERLHQVERNNHRVVEGGVRLKPLERKLLRPELLQRTVAQFVSTSTMLPESVSMVAAYGRQPGDQSGLGVDLCHRERSTRVA